jgi:hypothetical protein
LSGIARQFLLLTFVVPRFREAIPIDDYVLDVLMRDIVGHDRQPAAYLVYVFLYGKAARRSWKPVEGACTRWRMRRVCRRAPPKPRSDCFVAES